jgi:GntR family transcriptional regulator, carbon starvation induced regulator
MQGRAAAETSVSIDILETGNPIEFGDTLANQVFRRLQGDILSGRFAPGTKLRQKDLGDDYGTSGSAIREALTQLVSIGLVVAEPQRGFRVAEASIANLIDLTKSRCWVEAIALRSAIVRGGRDWEAAIVAAAHMLGREQPKRGAKAKSSEPFDTIDSQWRQDHQNYHDTLISACDLTSLLTYRRNLIQLNERYRRLSSLILSGRNVAAEHDAITASVLARDSDLAVELIEAHFLETTGRVLAGTSAFQGSISETIEKLRAEIRAGDGRAPAHGPPPTSKQAAPQPKKRRVGR